MKQMTNADYHAHAAIGKSGLDQIAKSPAHYQSWLKNKTKPTPDMEFGSMVHLALLEPEIFYSIHVVNPGIKRNTKEGKIAFLEWESANQGKTLVDEDDWLKIQAMADVFRRNELVIGALAGAKVEQSIFWQDPETGVECKARPDIISSTGVIFDLKTASDISGWKFGGSAASYRYHVQAAHYLTGLSVATRTPTSEFVFIAIEKSLPFGVKFYRANSFALKPGFDLMRKDLNTYARCLKSGEWPSYPQVIEDLQLPIYAL